MTELAPRSSIDGLTWPGLPGGAAGKVLVALLYQLEQSQWWPPEALLEHQFRQLRVVLRYAYQTVPFYRERLGGAGIDPGKPITPETWSRIPILTRKEVQGSFDALTSRRIPTSHGKTNEISTSGSTGMPIKVLGTGLTQLFWWAFNYRELLWHGRDLSKKLTAIRKFRGADATYPKGISQRGWGLFADVYPTGPSALLNITTPVERQAEWLGRQEPGYLITYPSNLEQLARHCRQRGIELPTLLDISTLAEVLQPQTREACREAWGVPVVDVYSAQEVGYIALQCPDHEHYHVQAEGVLVEVVDDAGRPCAPGETGKVVVTPLHNFATPLVRYDIGDYAEVGEPCGCGRGLPVLSRINGRVRNMLTLPTGEQHWPFLGARQYNDVAPIRQYQFVQKTLELIEVKLVALRQVTADEEDKLREIIIARLGYPFELTFTYHDDIPRSAGGKYEDFMSEIVP